MFQSCFRESYVDVQSLGGAVRGQPEKLWMLCHLTQSDLNI